MFARSLFTMRALVILGALALSAGIAAPIVWAQSGTSGTIGGTIRDESGGALPGVTVTLSSPVLQLRQLVQVSDPAGNYQFVDIPAGTYKLTFELGGFSTAIREDLRLTVGFNARVDTTLKVGAMEESV